MVKSSPPPYLDGLLHVLTEVQHETPTPPTNRINQHPFFIPLTTATPASGPQTHTGLLRWPTPPESLPLPVVQARSDDLSLRLIAPSAKGVVTRAIASADYSGRTNEATEIRRATRLAVSYQDGDVASSGLGLERFLVLKGDGPFPDLYEGLAKFHEAKGDKASALVTCERAAVAFAGWAGMVAFHAGVLDGMGRSSEARDAARFALSMPLWTVGGENVVEQMRVLAGYKERESLEKIFRTLFEDKRENEVQEGKRVEQVALDRAAYLLDLCVAERGNWEAVRMDLADLYEEAGMADFATFVKY